MDRTEELLVVRMAFPVTDGQFRLRPCTCGDVCPGYVQTRAGGLETWAVRCFACGKTSDVFRVRHDAQVCWNGSPAERPGERRRKYRGKV